MALCVGEIVWACVGVIVWEKAKKVCGCDCVGEEGSVWVGQPSLDVHVMPVSWCVGVIVWGVCGCDCVGANECVGLMVWVRMGVCGWGSLDWWYMCMYMCQVSVGEWVWICVWVRLCGHVCVCVG